MEELMKNLGYRFRDEAILRQALTHSSYVNEHGMPHNACNERLEFLGDAVLELCTSEVLFSRYRGYTEGELTKLRASLVCQLSLADAAAKIGVGRFLLLGRGEDAGGGRRRSSILENAFEALVGAIYLDGGFTNAKEFVGRFITDDIEGKKLFFDSKTILQEKVQEKGLGEIEYTVIEESGPAHEKLFVSQVTVGGKVCGTGSGRSKKASEQQAAYQALLGPLKE